MLRAMLRVEAFNFFSLDQSDVLTWFLVPVEVPISFDSCARYDADGLVFVC
jgi:hypothetical protein